MSAFPTTLLGDTDVRVAKVAHGLMQMTTKNPVVDDETCFEAIKAGLDLVEAGERVLLNSAEFYGHNPMTANLQLLNRFFAKYPEYVDRALLSVKGGLLPTWAPDSSIENLRRSVTDCQNALGTQKKIDVFKVARLDSKHSVEEIMASMQTMRDEGLFSYIGLSEVSAETLRRACKVAHVTMVEIEVSPWSYDEKVQAVISAAEELKVNVITYSPLGKGFLLGNFKRDDLDAHDFRRMLPRFQDEAMAQNQKLVDEITRIAQSKGVTNAQLCIAWVGSLGSVVIPLPGSSAKARTLENFAAAHVELSPEEKSEIDKLVKDFEVVGDRYPKQLQEHLMK